MQLKNYISESRCIIEYKNHYSKLCANLQGNHTIHYSLIHMAEYSAHFKHFAFWILEDLYYFQKFFETYQKLQKLHMLSFQPLVTSQ